MRANTTTEGLRVLGGLIILDKTDVLGTFSEALAAHVNVILPNDCALVSCSPN